MSDRIPNEEETLEETRGDEYQAKLDDIERELPAFERELERIEERAEEE